MPPPSILTRGFNETEIIIAKTMEYLSIPAVVGFEQFFINHLHNDFENLGLTVTRHPGLLEISGTTPHSALVCAHIDRHGLISIGGGEYAYAVQYLRETKYNEEHKSSRKELTDIAGRFEGERVYAYDPRTGEKLGEGIISASPVAIENGDSIFHVAGMDHCEPGVPIAYARTARAGGGFLKGQIDNTISLGVIHALFRAGYQGTAWLTTEEEAGKSWVHMARQLERGQIETRELIVIDTSPYLSQAPLDEGAVILRTRDRFASFNASMTDRFRERCAALDIPFQVKDELMLAAGKTIDELGSTELGRLISERNNDWSGATVQIPTNLYHTSYETTSKAAIRNYYRFLKNILIKAPLKFRISEKQKQPVHS